MMEHLNNNHTSSDELLNQEQMMFPYLVTLDSDIDLLEKHENHTEIVAAPVVPTVKIAAETTQTNPISGLTTTIANTPTAENLNTETTQCTNETLDSLREQLAVAQRDIAMLRHFVGQSQIKFLDFGIRMLSMENTIGQLKLSQSIAQNTNFYVNHSALPKVQPGIPDEKDTKTTVVKTKRKSGRDTDPDLTPPQAKRARTTQTRGVYKGTKPFCAPCTQHRTEPCVKPGKRCPDIGSSVNLKRKTTLNPNRTAGTCQHDN